MAAAIKAVKPISHRKQTLPSYVWCVHFQYLDGLIEYMEMHNIKFENNDIPIDWWLNGKASTTSGEDPYAALYLTPKAPYSLVKAVYRHLVKEHHPDAGGDQEQFLRLQNAYEKITKICGK